MKVKTGVLFLLTGTFMLLAGPILGQSTKIIKEKKIASQSIYEYFVEEGIDEPLLESYEKYDAEGNLLEIKELNNKGEVKLWQKFVYDEEGNVVEEIFLDAKGRVESKEKSIYSDGLRIEKQFYNKKDKLVKRKVYEYEFRD
jgi:hypothetical protein